LDNKVFDIIDARCNHKDYSVMFISYYLQTNFETSFQPVFNSLQHNTY